MKSIYRALLLLALLLVMATPVLATSNNVDSHVQGKDVFILLDGQAVKTNPSSYIDPESEQTLVPLRFVSESLGAEVKWEQEENKITVTQGDKDVVMSIDSRDVSINGSEITLGEGITPKLVDQSTMVPFRFLSETFGYEVGYDELRKMPAIGVKHKLSKNSVTVSRSAPRNPELRNLELRKPELAKPEPAPLVNDLSQTLMAECLKYQGIPYASGGSSPSSGFDCSGLVQYNYKKAGVNLPRTAKEQWSATEKISSSEAKTGDLVFFKGTYGGANHISHVGIYVDRSKMYHSSSSRGVGYGSWSSGYWGNHFDSIRRIK